MYDQALAEALAAQNCNHNTNYSTIRNGNATPDTISSSARDFDSEFDHVNPTRTPPPTPTTPATHPSSVPSPTSRHAKPNPKDPSKLLPPVLEEGHPLLTYPASSWRASMIGHSARLYRFSSRVVYRSGVTPREADLTEAAGGDVGMRVLSRVIWKGSRPDTGTKALLVEMGRRFRFGEVVGVEQRRGVVSQMFRLLERLHNERGIVHGDVKESNFVWAADGTLRLVDFSSARFVEEPHGEWNSSFVSEEYITPARLERREVMRAEGLVGDIPAPTVFDDYFALAVTLWSMYSRRKPGSRQFNRAVIWKTDFDPFPDSEMEIREWIKKVLRMAGCSILPVVAYRDVFPESVDHGGQ